MEYIGLFLEEKDKIKLRQLFDLIAPELKLDKVEKKFFLDHVTLYHCNSKSSNRLVIRQSLVGILNDSYLKRAIIIKAIGYSDKAIAFKVQLLDSTPCDNENPHITIATINDGKPYDSNFITNWIDLPYSITIIGTLKMR